jgi:hypothetical protein
MPRKVCGPSCHDHTRKFRQQSVTGILYDPAVVLRDLRIDQFPEMRPQAFVRALLILTHQLRIARHIGGEDRGETVGRGHGWAGHPVRRDRALLTVAQLVHHGMRLAGRSGA